MREAPETKVRFGPAPRGRVTGWAVSCDDHGAMPVLAPTRGAARLAADRHAEHEHPLGAEVVESSGRRRGRA